MLELRTLEVISNPMNSFVNFFGAQDTVIVVKHTNNIFWLSVTRSTFWVIMFWVIYRFIIIRVCCKVSYFIKFFILYY